MFIKFDKAQTTHYQPIENKQSKKKRPLQKGTDAFFI